MKPAFYFRVSTDAQEFASQRHAVAEFVRRKEWPRMTKANTFAEKMSGAKTKRRELDRLLQACRLGHVDTVITYRVDRMGRSMAHLLQVHEELRTLKIRVVGASDSIDTQEDTAATNFFFRSLANNAEFQRELIVENTRAGQAAARKRGVKFGRPATMAKQIAAARKLRGKFSHRIIAEKTGLSKSYVTKIFKQPDPS